MGVIRVKKTIVNVAVSAAIAMSSFTAHAYTFSGNLANGSTAGGWELGLNSASMVSAYATATGADPMLFIIDSSGTLLYFDDDSGSGLDAYISENLSAGDYLLAVTDYPYLYNGDVTRVNSSGGGTFDLSVTGADTVDFLGYIDLAPYFGAEQLVIEETTASIAQDQVTSTGGQVARNTTTRVRGALVSAIIGNLNTYNYPTNGETGLASGDASSGDRGVWISPAFTQLNSDLGAGYSGRQISISGGYDQNIGNNAVLGISAVLESGDSNFDTGGRSVDSQALNIVAYAGKAFEGNIILDGFLGFGWTDNDIDQPGLSGGYDSDRYMLGLTLSKIFSVGSNVNVTLRGGLLHAHEDVDAYSMNNAAGVAVFNIASSDVDLTQGSVGVEVASQHGPYQPHVSLAYENDFDNSNTGADEEGFAYGIGMRYQKEENLAWGFALNGTADRDTDETIAVSADVRYSF
jgi:hypothetical protein